MDNISGYIRQKLEELRDEEYRSFHSKLMPETDPATIIGVRMPQLRKLAKEISAMPEAGLFMEQLPHRYYEENNLHGLLIEGMKDYDECMDALEHFLPYVDVSARRRASVKESVSVASRVSRFPSASWNVSLQILQEKPESSLRVQKRKTAGRLL